MKKEVILNPSVDPTQPKVILVDPVGSLQIPDGFYVDVLKNGDECIRDSFGRINASLMYEQARRMSPDMPDRSPNQWRRTKSAKKFEAFIESITDYPPCHAERGGKRMGDYQTADLRFDNEVYSDGGILLTQPTEPWEKVTSTYTPYRLPRSLNGNIQTYGTYMDVRVLIAWGMWVSIPFSLFVIEMFTNAGGELSGSGLILPFDELEKEVHALNQRSQEWVMAARNVSARYQSDNQAKLPDVPSYASFLRETYNLDINVSKLYGWLRFNGFFNFNYSHAGTHLPYTPEPDAKYVPSLFVCCSVRNQEGELIDTIHITPMGMDTIVEKLLNDFPQIAE